VVDNRVGDEVDDGVVDGAAEEEEAVEFAAMDEDVDGVLIEEEEEDDEGAMLELVIDIVNPGGVMGRNDVDVFVSRDDEFDADAMAVLDVIAAVDVLDKLVDDKVLDAVVKEAETLEIGTQVAAARFTTLTLLLLPCPTARRARLLAPRL
jgi:hypothetical protein